MLKYFFGINTKLALEAAYLNWTSVWVNHDERSQTHVGILVYYMLFLSDFNWMGMCRKNFVKNYTLEKVRFTVPLVRTNKPACMTTITASPTEFCNCIAKVTNISQEARSGAVGRGTALQAGSSRFRFPMASVDFLIGIILQAELWPRGRLSI
jgi:hypothetical protein